MVHRVIIDVGNSANILFLPKFEKLGLGTSCLKLVSYPVIGFTGASVIPEGTIQLPVNLGEGPQS